MTAVSDLILRAMSTQAFRLAAMSAAGFLLVSALIVGVLFWQTNTVLTDHVVDELRAEATELARTLAGADAKTVADTIRLRSGVGGAGLYLLWDPARGKIAGNVAAVPPELAANPPGGSVFRYQPKDAPGTSRLGVGIPIATGSGLSLVIGRDVEDQVALADRIKRTFLWGFGALALAALIAGIWIGRSVLGRIEVINATASSIMAGDLSRRIPVSGNSDELDTLSERLNAMLDRIEQLMSGLKEVSDNIAHDLKTPLNRLRNSAEAALRDSRGADAYREGLESTIEKADELIKTFNALLLIARLEAGVVEESAEAFDLGRLVYDVAELYEPVAEEAGLGLEIEAGEGMSIRANRQLVGQAVANLVDNAIKYSARAAEECGASNAAVTTAVAVRVTDQGDAAEISVADRGPGIAAEDRERALRRFVRLEKSRTQPGTGLGLSLVAAVARLHNGSVRLEDNDPGLRVVVTLPLAKRQRAASTPV
ncbi:ATP-binding protein [Hyphomicrobium sp.]|uniref:sensor histidine kinase n=1 Tax=Hyphomicrobium sp. TaxID=82 RepID=UPI002B743400|nr:ATP-binding protein [Hyphomicrobium sp.]HRN89768.1 ATP-binding protein [Hyphomicrobium sp.]HRQ26269.1 ATP-binding protein [Hyphomicrobium sp.]